MKTLLNTPIRYLKGIGPKRAKIFTKLGINTVEDILYYFPRRYEDRRKFSRICELKENQIQTIKAQILSKGEQQSFYRQNFRIVKLTVGDNTGKINCVWFNQPYLKQYFKLGSTLILYGKIERYAGLLQINNPEFEIVCEEEANKEESLNIGRFVPVYTVTKGITQRYLRVLIKSGLDEYLPKAGDCLPYDIRARNNLLNLSMSLINIHFPENLDLQAKAYERLSFEEFFSFQAALALRKLKKKEKLGIAHQINASLLNNFIASLPFKLTASQEKVIDEIKTDMVKPLGMQRLLQGDVGSGKTIVATIASMAALQGGYQAVFMAPTEILAKQHYEKISSQLSVLSPSTTLRADDERPLTTLETNQTIGSQQKIIKIGLLTSSLKNKEKERQYQEIKEGSIGLLIGTHALLEEDVKFKNLGLVIIDEQHKFGVGQRSLLPKKGVNPDVLIMTATPIPRTLAITLYGDLDLSIINELPAGRLPIKTLHFKQKDKAEAYNIAKEQLKIGKQAYVIYPVIEESYVLDIAGAKKMSQELKSGEFKEFGLGLIHGRLKQEEQDEIILKFKNKELDILVSTTILEVGIDIPGVTCMIIENAERFGLSQLHQLRGRIGRGKDESFCVLISDDLTPEAEARTKAMLKYSDGFRIAEEDLKIRGPGEFFGSRQSGLWELKIGNPLTQMHLLKRAREEAIKLVSLDPHLTARQNILLKQRLIQRFPGYESLISAG
ncbi:MAG: ATP-dependent DNA helicase RecG [Candidatus Omnitrophota bacterium]|nr:ATP-dependent DNA helicase RecG [Candidatus Omnitrophota bacterium]